MNRPAAFAPPLPVLHSRRMVVALSAVIVIHVALLYAFTSGLAMRILRETPQILEAEIVKPPPQKMHPIPPPPKPQMAKPVLPTVPAPQIRIRVPPKPRAIAVVKQVTHPTPPTPPVRVVAAAPPPAPVTKAVPVSTTPARPIAATHTTPPYPPIARRLNWQGTVLLGVDIGLGGNVTNATVISSSGHSELDSAAQQWVQAKWRWRPASRNGSPVPSHARVKVLFNLRNAGSL